MPLKEIELMPSTIETIDTAMYEFINDHLNLFASTNKGWKKTPVIWVSAERSFQIKSDKDIRDSKGTLKLPLITVNRTGVEKSLSRKGGLYGNVPPGYDAKGGSITIGKRIGQKVTKKFANAQAKRKRGQLNFPRKNDKIVYETISIPMPVYLDITYEITIQTEYQQQMNELFTPFVTRTGGINYFTLKKDGHLYEAFIDEAFTFDDNIASIDEDERSYKITIPIKVLGYIYSADKNEERPKIVIRENAVEFRITRERVIVGDEHDLADTALDAFYRE